VTHKGPVLIGVDTGGTFTDLLCLDDRGLRVHKLRSTPNDPSAAILQGIRELLGPADNSTKLSVTHGSTVATNAVLERKGARVALVATAGFEDVLRLGRQTRPELYNFNATRPEPLIPPERSFGVAERISANGEVLVALDESTLQALVEQLRDAESESVAVCMLHSYAYPQHEAIVAKALRQAGFAVSASHEVLPEYREFERWSTTAVNAYVAPKMSHYLQQLALGIRDMSDSATLRVMQSNGGSISSERAGREAVQTILSGPTAGVVGAHALGEASGFHRLITFDMGGTSTDVSLVDGHIGTTSDSLVGDLPVRLPVLDIHTVGAGGGSVAWIDSGGVLRVGPRSAGANPGPTCFGTGTELTVTDANLLLGRLDPAYFLGGRMPLDVARTEAIAAEFAARLGLAVHALAAGIVRIANANMERAVRVVSVSRGFDPRDFALLAFGGAGGLHACELADSLEMTTVLVPEHAGVLSALGMLLADVTKDSSASLLRLTEHLSPAELSERLATLTSRAYQELASEGFGSTDIIMQSSLAMRYKGQAFEIDVPLSDDTISTATLQALIADFHVRHQQRYGYSNPSRATEVVQLRLRAIGKTVKPPLSTAELSHQALPAPDAVRATYFAGELFQTPRYHRSQLSPGMHGEGPALIISGESTQLIPPHWGWKIDPVGTLIAHRSGGAA
jgi:N-methylhydantoinase A/oxoprolinase/acetone carboxylase beta subunit